MNIPAAIAAVAPDGKLTTAQKRRFLIDMCKRRIKPGTGSGREFLLRRTAMTPWPDLRPILKGIPWAIVGAVATRAYMPERATKVLDVLAHVDDADEVIERLEAAGYVKVSRLAVPGYLLRSPDGVDVDVIFGEYPWLIEALTHRRPDPAGFPVLDLPYLVLMKTEASHVHDMGDVSRMLGLASEKELTHIRNVAKRYAPYLLDDIESLIYLGKVEMQGTL